MGFLSLFKKKETTHSDTDQTIEVDMHSHLLPNLDDGVESFDDAISVIKELKSLGYNKLITTPHIMGDFYKNTQKNINEQLNLLKERIDKENIDIEIEAAAEYYLDEWFISKLKKPEELLIIDGKYLLFETSYINEPAHLNEAIFQIKSLGLFPILAHPERYTYLYNDFNKTEEIYNKGVFFQININSLSGYYSKEAQKLAQKLLDKQMVHFAGTDCHGTRHVEALKKTRTTKSYNQLLKLNLLNNTLS
jgi:protein-tyrosine phosphatase